MIGVPDAADLPLEPGHGYLRRSCTVVRFRSHLADRTVPRTGRRAHRSWLPPLTPSTVDSALLGTAGSLRVPVAVLDKPFEHRQDPLWLDLSGPPGNLVVVGDTGSGKTTLLQTFIGAMAATHTARQAQFHHLDAGDAPRTIAHLHALLGHRRDTFERRGIHLVVTSPTYAEVPAALRPFHAVTLELRLRDPATSRAGRRAAARLWSHRPGRGLTSDGLHFQTNLPPPCG